MRESLGNIFATSKIPCKRRETLPHIQEVDFDEALSRLGVGIFNYSMIFIAGIVITVSSFETLGISFVFPSAECDLNLTTERKGILSGISSVGIIVGSCLWGFCSDFAGRKKMIVSTLGLNFISSLFSSLAPNYETLLLFRFLSGFFVSGSSATIYVYLSEFHCSLIRSKVVLAASFVYGVACNYMAIAGYVILNLDFSFHLPTLNIDYKPWRLYLIACSLPSLLCAIVLTFFPESPKFLYSKGNEEKALVVLHKIYRINNSKNLHNYSVSKILKDHDEVATQDTAKPLQLLMTQAKLLFSSENLQKTILLCLVQFLLYGSCHGLYMFFPEIVDKIEIFANENPSNSSSICEILADESIANRIDSSANDTCSEKIETATFGYSLIVELCYMVGFLIITFIINRVTKLSILLVILFGCGLSGFLTLFVKTPLISIFLYIIFMLSFLAVNIVYAATCNLYPTKLRGIATNITMMFGRIGSAFGTFIVGQMLVQNCEMTFGFSSGLMLLCSVLSIFIPEIRKIEGRK